MTDPQTEQTRREFDRLVRADARRYGWRQTVPFALILIPLVLTASFIGAFIRYRDWQGLTMAVISFACLLTYHVWTFYRRRR